MKSSRFVRPIIDPDKMDRDKIPIASSTELPAGAAEDVVAARGVLMVLVSLGFFAGVAFAGFGFWLIMADKGNTQSTLSFFGQKLETDSAGVVCIFIGAVVAIVTARHVAKSLIVAINR